MTVHVVTDSTSDIPQAIADEHNITVIPLTITIGSESYRDGVDLDADAFYTRLPDEKQLPATSQPPPALFQHAYEHLITRGEAVSVHLSHKFSGHGRDRPGVPLHVGRFSPVLGTHGGPGMLGIAVVDSLPG